MEEKIIEIVCEVFGISKIELFNDIITHEKTKVRMAIAYIMAIEYGFQHIHIASYLRKHKSTISYYVSLAIDLMEYDKDFHNKITNLIMPKLGD